MDRGAIGLLVGCILVSLLGGVLGTYGSLRSAQSPAERKLVILWAIAFTVGIALLCGGTFLVPQPYRWLFSLSYPICLSLALRASNRSFAKIRAAQRPEEHY
jgi:hypothetical protein